MPGAAKVAVLLTNLWMGFPYMFLVCTGALQAIPEDLTEAAKIDGASGFAGFRRITFPLLLVTVAPLLVATFAFNFNNFNAIYLLTEGGPFSPDNPNAGGTDILISYTIRLAFGAGGAADRLRLGGVGRAVRHHRRHRGAAVPRHPLARGRELT